MIQIHIEAATPEEAREQAAKLFLLTAPPVLHRGVVPEPLTSGSAPVSGETEPPAPPKPVHFAPFSPLPKAEIEEPQEIEPATPDVPAEAVRAALNGLRKRKGTDALREIFTRYGVNSFPELDPAVYHKLMHDLEEENNG